jgi:hypothetical protein
MRIRNRSCMKCISRMFISAENLQLSRRDDIQQTRDGTGTGTGSISAMGNACLAKGQFMPSKNGSISSSVIAILHWRISMVVFQKIVRLGILIVLSFHTKVKCPNNKIIIRRSIMTRELRVHPDQGPTGCRCG